jgi:hypothetical protein
MAEAQEQGPIAEVTVRPEVFTIGTARFDRDYREPQAGGGGKRPRTPE